MVAETDLAAAGGRTLHVYDSGDHHGNARLAVFWHHGTPSIGAPPEPLFAVADELGIRWVSHDRPGYGGSSPHRGRNVASAASDVAAIADALHIERFAVMGVSGGGPHALACAALLPSRVLAAGCLSGPGPFDAAGLDWFAGMHPSGAAEYRAAASGRAALQAHLAVAEFDPDVFTPGDHAAVVGAWAWMGGVAAKALASDQGGMVDDDLALVAPWGFDPSQIRTPVLFVSGRSDRLVPSGHATWLAQRCPMSELWLRPDDGHVSILNSSAAALGWLREHARER